MSEKRGRRPEAGGTSRRSERAQKFAQLAPTLLGLVGMFFGHSTHHIDQDIPGPHPVPDTSHGPHPAPGHDPAPTPHPSTSDHPNPVEAVSALLAKDVIKQLKPEDQIARVFKLRRKTRARLMAAGAVVLLIGWFVPWHVLIFDPTTVGPHGSIDVGSSDTLTVNGQVVHQYAHWYNGPAEAAAGASAPVHIPAAVMYVTSTALVLMALLTAVATSKNPSWAVRRGLASLGSVIPLVQLVVFVQQLPKNWATGPLLKANVQGFLAKYGNGPEAVAAARHLSLHLFLGYYVLLLGIGLAVLGTLSGQKPEPQAGDGGDTVLIATKDRAGTGKTVHKAVTLVLKLATVALLFWAAVEIATRI
ncbi:hypothetical protein ACFYNO_34970 [Kitasatospora sp. NPDC006697]|uniref:hypothetical protein n=1 Tax=Kitasatospora sp. NPDC006697 TaxID=3364020 RepID=UPI00368D81AA